MILSKNSLNSDWIEHEVTKALQKEKETKEVVLFPVRLDDAIMEADFGWVAALRRTRHIANFHHWKNHDAYQAALEKLLRDLKAEPEVQVLQETMVTSFIEALSNSFKKTSKTGETHGK